MKTFIFATLYFFSFFTSITLLLVASNSNLQNQFDLTQAQAITSLIAFIFLQLVAIIEIK